MAIPVAEQPVIKTIFSHDLPVGATTCPFSSVAPASTAGAKIHRLAPASIPRPPADAAELVELVDSVELVSIAEATAPTMPGDGLPAEAMLEAVGAPPELAIQCNTGVTC